MEETAGGCESQRENWPQPLLISAKGELAKTVLETSPWWLRHGRAGGLTNPAQNQDQIPAYVLARPKSHTICVLLEPEEVVGNGREYYTVLRTQDTGQQRDVQEESQ